jgi:hypothetical protein
MPSKMTTSTTGNNYCQLKWRKGQLQLLIKPLEPQALGIIIIIDLTFLTTITLKLF